MATKRVKSTTKPYKIRIRPGLAESSASEKDILKRIEKGKLTGDEQISLPPHDKWEKLSSHPTFYDAFLKRLYQDNYQAPAEEDKKVKKKTFKERGSIMDRATRQGELRKEEDEVRPEPPDDGKTSQLAGGAHSASGGTIHQSAIDELFSNVEGPKESSQIGTGTGLIKIDVPAASENLPPIDAPLMPHADESFPDSAPPKSNRFRLYLIGGLALVLMLLFEMGKSDTTSSKSGESSQKELSADLRELIDGSSNKMVKLRTLLQEGDHLYENDTPLFYQGARDLYAEATQLDGSNTYVRGRFAEASARLLSLGLAKSGTLDEIKNAIVEGRKNDPQFSQFYRVEALLSLNNKQYDEAKHTLSYAAESDPANSDNQLIKGEILFAAGDLKGAQSSFGSVLQTESRSIRALYFAQLIALGRGDYATAEKAAFRTLTLNPIHALSFFTLGQVAADQNRLKEAKQLYQTCVALAPFAPAVDVGRAYYRLGLLQELSGDKDASIRSFRLAVFYDPQEKALTDEKLKNAPEIAGSIADLATANEYSPAYYTEQAESLIAQKKYAEALTFLRAATVLQPTSGMAQVRMGEVTEKLVASYEDFQTAIGFYQRAIEKEPTLSKAYIKLGLLETEQYNFERAYKLLKQAQALGPEDPDSYVAMGKFFFKEKDYTAAIDQLSKAFKLNPYDSEILYYAGLLALLGRKDGQRDAINFFYRSYLLNPNNYDALVEWAKLKVLRFEKNFALKFVRNLIEQDANNPNWYWVMGEIYAANKEFRRAVTFYHQALDRDNHLSKVRMSLARSLEAVGEFDGAISEYTVASQLDRRNSEGAYRAAELLLAMKNYKEAEKGFRDLIEITPNYPSAHRSLAQIYAARDIKDKAMEEMHKEVTINPFNVNFRLEYAQLLMSYGKQELAVAELTDVTNLPSMAKPDAANEKIRAFLLLSRCYRDLNRFDSAEGTIQLALEIDPDDPELHRELGYVYHGEQRDKEAAKAFEFYLSRTPAASDSGTIKAILQNSIIDE